MLSRFLGKKIEQLSRKYRDKYGEYIGRVYEILAGMREIRIFSAKPWANQFFFKKQTELIRLNIKNSEIMFKAGKINEFAALISTLAVYITAAWFIFRGDLTVGFFIAVIEYSNSMQGMINWTISNYLEWQNRKVNVDRVAEILDLEVEKNDKQKQVLCITGGKVSFTNVDFHYDEGMQILSDATFQIEAGEKVAIVGTSGVGKSTIIGILLGFYPPITGKVEIDSQDISLTYKSVRSNIGIVQQDIMLFDGTIRMNLCFGKQNATDKELWDACKKAHIAEYIAALPQKFDTVISKDGSVLSGGQKQRLMLARVFLKNPRILVFDEATSALDNEAEQVVLNAISELEDNRTIITISHRLSTVIKMDRIIVLHDGRVVSSGTHDYLLLECPYYRELFEGQVTKVGENCA